MNKNFIKATEKYSTLDEYVPAPLLRKTFVLGEKPDEASLSICGLGFYTLYINGVNITKGHLAPYISNPDHLCYYDTYDVKEYLTVGKNVIAIMLGNGMNSALGGLHWDFELADFRSAPRVALELNLTTDEKTTAIIADESFRTHPSPLIFDDLRAGEIYDARLEVEGWTLPDFDDSEWEYAIKAETPRGRLKLCEAEPIRSTEELTPVKIFKEGDSYIYDFGKNTAGIPILKIKGWRGQQITLLHFEALDKNGKFYNDNLKNRAHDQKRKALYEKFCQTGRFTCSGREDTYTPLFTYYGFRYVKVDGISEEQATKDLLTYRVMSSSIKRIGGFKCSDERINTLYKMVDNANLSNFYYFPTDCPHREKNGWMGDAALSAEQMTMQYDTTASFREYLTNIRAAMNERGELPGIVPTAGWGFHWGNGPTWDQALFRLTYALYKFRGNTEVVAENAHAMVRYLEYILTRRSEDGTIAIGLGDWVPVGKDKSNDYDAPLALTDTIAVMEMARAASEMLSAIGRTHSAAFAEGIYRDMRETIRRELIEPDMAVKGRCQTSQAIALYRGVFNEDERERAFAHLVNFIHQKDDTFDCGCIGMHAIFHVLSDFGESELAFKMITRDKFPSYTLLIDEGYTALPEKFHQCGGETYNLSMNHHFLGDISRWFVTKLAGLEVIDHNTVMIRPCPVASVDYAEAYYDLPGGRVSVSWKRDENGKINVSYTAPDGVTVIRK